MKKLKNDADLFSTQFVSSSHSIKDELLLIFNSIASINFFFLYSKENNYGALICLSKKKKNTNIFVLYRLQVSA
jgi:hypothetical protein